MSEEVVVVVSGGEPPDPRAASVAPLGAPVVAADRGLEHALALGLEVDGRRRRLRLRLAGGASRWPRASGTRVERHPAGEGRDRPRARARRARSRSTRRGSSCSPATAAGSTTCSPRCSCSARERYAGVRVDALVGPAWVHVMRELAGARGTPRRARLAASRSVAAEGVTTDGLVYPLRGETLEAGIEPRCLERVRGRHGSSRRRARRPPRDTPELEREARVARLLQGALRALAMALALVAAGCGGTTSADARSCSSRTTPSRSRTTSSGRSRRRAA